MPKAEKAGFPTYWTEFGQGRRSALMIHCSLAHSGSWERLAHDLSSALTMTAFDIPGHGRSAPWDGRGEIQAVTTQIAAGFLDGRADIIGHSFGATVALRLAVERPDLVRSLTLIEPVFFAVALADDPGIHDSFEAEMAAFSMSMAAGDHRTAAREFTRIWGDGTPWENIPDEQRQAMAARMPLVEAGRAALFDDVGGMLKPGVLRRAGVPTLLIEGSESPAIISSIHAGLAARLPCAERAIITGAAHMAPVTHAPQVATIALRFLYEG